MMDVENPDIRAVEAAMEHEAKTDKDALEELRDIIAHDLAESHVRDLVRAAIAAWEKERATSVPLFHAHVALRAQVEKVRDDLRRDAVDSDLTGMWAWAVKERAHADALDAALGGGA